MGGKKNKKAKKAALRASVPRVQFRNGTSGPNQDPSGCQKTSGEPKCTPRIQRQESFLRRMLSLNFLGRRPKAETSEASSYKTASARSPLTSTTDSFSDTITVPADTSDSTSSNLSKSAKRKQRLLKTVQIKAELNATNSPIKDRSNCTISFLCPSRNLDDLKDLVDTVVNMDSEEEGRISAMRQINDTLKTTEDYLKRICLRMFLSDWGISSVLSESGVDTGDSDLTSEFRIYRDSEKADDLAGDKNTSRSAIELLRNVVDKHKTHTNIVMDALELLLVLDSDRLTCLPALLRNLQNGRKELPSPAPSDPEHNSTDPLHLDTSTPQLKFDRNANALKPEPSSDIDNSNTGLHSYSIVLKAPTTPAPIRGAPPPPPPPGHLPSVRALPPPPPPLGITTPKASYVTVPSTPVCRSPPPPPPPIELTSLSAAPLCRVAPPPPPPPPPGPTSPGFAAPVPSIPSTPVSSRRAPPPPPPPPSGLHGSPLPLISISGPPPPPPPPGVTMSPGLTPKPVKSEEFYPKNKKTCPIRWVKISHHNIQDVSTVWSDYSRPDFSTSERMDLETMFEVTEVKTPRLGSIKKKIEPDYLQEAHLDANRTLALEVLLAKFKGPSMEVVAKLESCVVGVYSTDLLTSLLQAFPTNEEVEPFLAMEMPPNGKANRLCWEVARKPQLKSRVELMVARETLPPEVTQRLDDCKNLASAFETLRGEVVLRVLHKCLQCGNFVNQGSPMAHAAGFRLSSLPDLLATKAKNSNANFRRFVDFLVRNMEIGDSEVDEVIDSLVAFTKLSTDDLWAEHERLSRSLAKLKASVQSKGDEGLLQIYRDSLESSEKDMDCLASEVATLRQTEKEVLAYFCADKTDTMAVIASTLTTAFKSIGEALKSMKSPLTRSQSMMSLTRSTSLLDNTLGSLRREDSFRLSLRKKTPVVCPSREQLSSIFLNTPNRH